jgi:GH18 family chitinase
VSPPDQHTIFSDILLSSDIKGKVYNPAYYLSNNSDSVAANLDLVMLTNGWRRFDWDKIKAIFPRRSSTVETGYMKLKGKVLGYEKKQSIDKLNLIVLNKDSSRQLISVPVEKDGSFEYPMVFFDTAKVFYSVNNNKSLTEKAELQISNGLLKLSPKNITPCSVQ